MEALQLLNTHQRNLVLRHVESIQARLLYVQTWNWERIPTVFGELEVSILLWVTSTVSTRPLRFESDEYFASLLRQDVAAKSLPKTGAKAKARSIGTAPAVEVEPPLKFTDAVGRKFVFPWAIVKTWSGMENLIRSAFQYIDVIGPHVQQGHYDLVSANNEYILPQVWEQTVKP
ncbi:hypothetical protein M011DRAFT_403936, partial [Sporormia fimetaria CBS 119925]